VHRVGSRCALVHEINTTSPAMLFETIDMFGGHDSSNYSTSTKSFELVEAKSKHFEGSHGKQIHTRSLVNRTTEMAYQSVGIGSNNLSSETFPVSVETKISTGQIRQSDVCSLHQSQEGVEPIKQVMHENKAFVESDNRQSFDLTGSPYRWEGQCPSGSIVPEKGFSNGMVLEDGSGAEYFLDVGSPIDGSVCIQTEPSNEDILQLISDSRSICDRCSLKIV